MRDNMCYGLNADAKLLCTHAQAIDAFDITTIRTLFAQVTPQSKIYDILS